MNMRVSTASTYARVLNGLQFNFDKLIRSQEQVASGRRILRPSDDPTGTARALSFNRRIANTDRFLSAINDGLTVVDGAAAALENGSGIMAEVRELLIQSMNGTLSQSDRDSIAVEIELLQKELMETANTRSADRYLFGGTQLDQQPWSTALLGGFERAVYAGNQDEQKIRIGVDVEVAVNIPGSAIFAKNQFTGVQFAGLTGLAGGTTADEGSGYEYIELKHTSTDPGTLASVGIALANGGASDTLLGTQDLVIDAAAGTVQLGSGKVLNLPDPTSGSAADFVVTNELGAELHLDLSGFTGASLTTAVSGAGTISIDGGATTAPLDFLNTNLELINSATGNVVHVDTTSIARAGRELIQFSGNVNVFDTLGGIAADLRNGDALDVSELVDRLGLRLGELDRNADNLLVGLSTLGSRSARMSSSDERLQGVRVQLSSALSQVQDADYTDVVIKMSQAEQTLQLAQATGVRLMENNLLRFLN